MFFRTDQFKALNLTEKAIRLTVHCLSSASRTVPDKPFQFHNNYDNRPFSKPKSALFANLIKNGNFNKHDSSSNQDLDKSDYIEFKPGMQDVPAWLKSLRLHKYKQIFSELTYEEMLGLTEQQLEEKNVTKGARHKIIVNIDKLRARQANVESMEKSVEQEGVGGIKQCLNELKTILATPIKAFEHDKGMRVFVSSRFVSSRLTNLRN